MGLRTQLCCFYINETAEWLSGPDGSARTRSISEALLVRPEEVEGVLKEHHILTKTKGSVSMHILEASFVLKRRVKLT